MENPMVNYANIIKDTTSAHYNIRDEYKNNSVEENIQIQKSQSRNFSVGCINVAGDLNLGMMIRSACLFGAENFYIFGRKKFDKRSTVGAEKYINIVHYTFDDPINADCLIRDELLKLGVMHSIILCETGGEEIGTYKSLPWHKRTGLVNPLFLFGSESHGIPDCIKSSFMAKMTIPQVGVMRSFNVSAAMNIMVWDYLKEVWL